MLPTLNRLPCLRETSSVISPDADSDRPRLKYVLLPSPARRCGAIASDATSPRFPRLSNALPLSGGRPSAADHPLQRLVSRLPPQTVCWDDQECNIWRPKSVTSTAMARAITPDLRRLRWTRSKMASRNARGNRISATAPPYTHQMWCGAPSRNSTVPTSTAIMRYSASVRCDRALGRFVC